MVHGGASIPKADMQQRFGQSSDGDPPCGNRNLLFLPDVGGVYGSIEIGFVFLVRPVFRGTSRLSPAPTAIALALVLPSGRVAPQVSLSRFLNSSTAIGTFATNS